MRKRATPGRKSLDVIVMSRILVLQSLCNPADEHV
jgi:hypothetical protein